MFYKLLGMLVWNGAQGRPAPQVRPDLLPAPVLAGAVVAGRAGRRPRCSPSATPTSAGLAAGSRPGGTRRMRLGPWRRVTESTPASILDGLTLEAVEWLPSGADSGPRARARALGAGRGARRRACRCCARRRGRGGVARSSRCPTRRARGSRTGASGAAPTWCLSAGRARRRCGSSGSSGERSALPPPAGLDERAAAPACRSRRRSRSRAARSSTAPCWPSAGRGGPRRPSRRRRACASEALRALDALELRGAELEARVEALAAERDALAEQARRSSSASRATSTHRRALSDALAAAAAARRQARGVGGCGCAPPRWRARATRCGCGCSRRARRRAPRCARSGLRMRPLAAARERARALAGRGRARARRQAVAGGRRPRRRPAATLGRRLESERPPPPRARTERRAGASAALRRARGASCPRARAELERSRELTERPGPSSPRRASADGAHRGRSPRRSSRARRPGRGGRRAPRRPQRARPRDRVTRRRARRPRGARGRARPRASRPQRPQRRPRRRDRRPRLASTTVLNAERGVGGRPRASELARGARPRARPTSPRSPRCATTSRRSVPRGEVREQLEALRAEVEAGPSRDDLAAQLRAEMESARAADRAVLAALRADLDAERAAREADQAELASSARRAGGRNEPTEAGSSTGWPSSTARGRPCRRARAPAPRPRAGRGRCRRRDPAAESSRVVADLDAAASALRERVDERAHGSTLRCPIEAERPAGRGRARRGSEVAADEALRPPRPPRPSGAARVVSAPRGPARAPTRPAAAQRQYPWLRGALVKLAHDDPAGGRAAHRGPAPRAGRDRAGRRSTTTSRSREVGTFAVTVAGGRAYVNGPRRAPRPRARPSSTSPPTRSRSPS